MLLNQDTATASGGAAMPAATACGNCGADERRLLHNVRHRGIFRRLCTSCVVRLHPQSFCPTCFYVYHPSPPPSGSNGGAVTCFKCYSSSHPHCVGPNPPSPYICPLCVNPNAQVSSPKRAKDLNLSDDVDGRGVNLRNCRVIDRKAARILLAAAKISAASMSKAALAARAEAERRAKEAALARKRAREAVEHATILMAREKLKKNEPSFASSVEISRSGGNVGGMVRDRRAIVNNNCDNRVGNAGSGKVVVGAVEEKNRVNNVERMDSSNEVLAALNAVELREKKSGGVKPHGLISGPSLSDGVAMEAEENRGMPSNPNWNHSSSGARNHGGSKMNERSGDSAKNQNDQGEKMNIGVVRPPPEEGQMRGVENGHAGEPDNARSKQ